MLLSFSLSSRLLIPFRWRSAAAVALEGGKQLMDVENLYFPSIGHFCVFDNQAFSIGEMHSCTTFAIGLSSL